MSMPKVRSFTVKCLEILALGFVFGCLGEETFPAITNDLCPTQKEDMDQFQDQDGCPEPDNDNDGVLDRDTLGVPIDLCRDRSGPAATNGCVDTDSDGIMDSTDAGVTDRCPAQAGPAATRGCPDTDGDGMPDVWESAQGTNPNVDDASADPDMDNKTNIEEYNGGTNSTNPTNADTDGDTRNDDVDPCPLDPLC